MVVQCCRLPQVICRFISCPARMAQSGGHWVIALHKIHKAPKDWDTIFNMIQQADRMTAEAGSGGRVFTIGSYTPTEDRWVGRGERAAAVAKMAGSGSESNGENKKPFDFDDADF